MIRDVFLIILPDNVRHILFLYSFRSVLEDSIYLTMSSEYESSDDEQQNTGPMRGQVTEKNPNYEKKKKCNCSKGCSKRSCSCFKFGSGCNSSCQNMFNHLDYIFGVNSNCTANPCFANWLVKNVKNADELRQKIIHSGR